MGAIACSGSGPGGNAGTACPTGEPLATPTVSYAVDVRPIFSRNGCLSCHGGFLPASGLDLGTYETSFGPGDQAVALGRCDIVPGNAEASYLLEKISSSTPARGATMPLLRTMLSADDIALVRTWILEGAQDN